MQTSASLRTPRQFDHYRGAKKVMQSPFLAAREFQRVKFTRTRHLNYQAAFQDGPATVERGRERGREEKPGGDYARRKLPRRKERNSVRFFELCRHPSLFLPSSRPIIVIVGEEERTTKGGRARDTRRTGSLCVKPVMRLQCYTNG